MRPSFEPRDELLCPDAPSALQVEITSHCNLRCKMCPLTTGSSSTADSGGHIGERTWSEVMALARRADHVFVSGFGEPLTNPRCLELLQQLNDEGRRTTLTTNGLALNPATANRLARLAFLVHVNVSIDSPDTATYRRIRGGSLERALRGLGNLVAAMPDTGRITVSSVAMRENVEQLADFPALLAEAGIGTYIVQGLNNYTAFSESQSLVGVHRLSEHLTRLRAACGRWGIELVLTTAERTLAEENSVDTVLAQYYEDIGDATPRGRQCMLPWDLPYIDKDGGVFPCCIAGASSQSQLGQLGQPERGTFDDIWHGPAYQDFRKALLDPLTTPPVCRGCTIVPAGPHPLRAYAASLIGSTRVPTRDGRVTVRFRNTGTEVWAGDTMQVATTTPRDRPSEIEHATWPSNCRAGSFLEAPVAPGEVATFSFAASVPPRRTVEEFQLVARGVHWVPNTRFVVVTPTALRRPIRFLHWAAGHSRLALTRRSGSVPALSS